MTGIERILLTAIGVLSVLLVVVAAVWLVLAVVVPMVRGARGSMRNNKEVL